MHILCTHCCWSIHFTHAFPPFWYFFTYMNTFSCLLPFQSVQRFVIFFFIPCRATFKAWEAYAPLTQMVLLRQKGASSHCQSWELWNGYYFRKMWTQQMYFPFLGAARRLMPMKVQKHKRSWRLLWEVFYFAFHSFLLIGHGLIKQSTAFVLEQNDILQPYI